MSDRTIVFDEHHAEGLRSLAVKFRSGNDVPVERATITREEWEAVCAFVRDQETIIDDRDEHVETLTAELEALRRDAERYRWIRERAGGSTCDFEVVEDAAWAAKYGAPDNFDMNIDEAIAAARQQEAAHADK